MTLRELYDNIGGNYDDALSRLMNDRLIEKFIRKYPQDGSYAELIDAVNAGDRERSFRAAHTIKGVAGNLAFTELAAAASVLTEQLRPLTDEADPVLLAQVTAAHDKIMSGLERYLA